MSLEVFIQPKPECPFDDVYKEIFAFEDNEGYYWYLHPLFEELRERTGQYIDLYGTAAFGGTTLDDLKKTLVKAIMLTQLQPQSWEVRTGTQTAPVRKQIYVTVHKQEFLEMLGQLESAVEEAQTEGAWVTFCGD